VSGRYPATNHEAEDYEAGDVLVIDGDSPDKFLHSSEPYSMFVAGIYFARAA
jgi:hypothetical protein